MAAFAQRRSCSDTQREAMSKGGGRSRFFGGMVVLFVLVLAVAGGAAGETPEPGTFVVARPDLPDPRFAESVVLLIEHGPEGSLGLIINRPSKLNLSQLIPQIEDYADIPDLLFYGGPVAPSKSLVLLRSDQPPARAQAVFDDVHVLALGDLLLFLMGDDLAQGDAVRIYFGYAGWGPGQLQRECDRGDWRVAAASAQTIFAQDADEIWPSLRERLPPLFVEQGSVRPVQAGPGSFASSAAISAAVSSTPRSAAAMTTSAYRR